MLVPLSWKYPVPSPPGSFPSADHRETPGAITSGFSRPSAMGPRLLNEATFSSPTPFDVAPTAITFFAPAKGFMVFRAEPEFPAAKTTRKSWLFQMKLSVSADSWIYSLQQEPQLFEWIQELRLTARCHTAVMESK